MAMEATGHHKHGMGNYGHLVMTAPRWMLSRIALHPKGMYHVARAGKDYFKGQKSASEYIARQYVKGLMNTAISTGALQFGAGMMFGFDNVGLERNPFAEDFGYLRIFDLRFDVSGGTAFMFRQAARLRKGTSEAIFGDDKERDSDVGKAFGNTIASRFSPVGRDIGYLFQSQKPVGSNEKIGFAEYAIRNMTWLTYQGIVDAALKEDYTEMALMGVFESFGSSGHAVKQ